MDRVIKFRGLRSDGKGWVYGFLVEHNVIRVFTEDKTVGFYTYDDYEVIQETISQFTGLKDENGKEIYEGDILRHLRKYNTVHISICRVIYRKGSYQLYYGNLIYDSIENISRSDYIFEVIGNIHEGKEVNNGQ